MMRRCLYLLLLTLSVASCDQVAAYETHEHEVSEAFQATEVILTDLVITPGDFQDSSISGMAYLPEGLTPSSNSAEGTFISAVTAAPIRFNALVPQWKIDQPENSGFLLELRTGDDPARLGEWIQIHNSEDWTLPEDEDIVGDMLVVPARDITHEFFQYRVILARDDGQNGPLLRELKFTFVDSTTGLSVEEMILRQEQINLEQEQVQYSSAEELVGYPKPFVISRDVWCTDPACNYSEGLEYYSVTHLLLHHTVTSTGADGDSAAVVRAIWAFHTSGRGWRDIGYNYLVDPAGVIFEGHNGGDDVVGIHAAGANTGSMGVAMIGDYRQIKPSNPMIESAVNLFSWKADQKSIDVFDASNTLPNIEWGLPHLMSHRDVYGDTECPGNVAHALTPTIRNEIASQIGLESPHIYIDELSASFQKSNTSWLEGPFQCGHNTHSWYAWSTIAPGESTNWGEWRPLIPESGNYQIEIYAPYCNTGQPETTGARYAVKHAAGTSKIVVNQDDRVGLWTSLGKFTLLAGKESSVYLDNLTDTDEGRGVWFDSIRLLPLDPLPIVILNLPADGSWLTDRDVNFTWQLENVEQLKATVLQVATDYEFQNRIVNDMWLAPVLNAIVNLKEDYADLYWRVVVITESNNEYPSAVNRFSLDSEPPSSKVTNIYWFDKAGYYQVFWQGKDALSGINAFNIDYRLSTTPEQAWQAWQYNAQKTNALFLPPDPDVVYEFRSQAVDKLGNKEVLHATADFTTDEAIHLSNILFLPVISGS